MRSRIVQPIDETRLTELTGNIHPMAQKQFDRGLVDPQLPMERMQLLLKRSLEQERALESFMGEQYDPKSANFHRWLTPTQFGKIYGPSDGDIATVTNWLQNHGFRIDLVTKGRVTIEFSGTAEQVRQAFHTEMHRYLVEGVEHVANDREPQIPEALAPVVGGVASLHNFFPVPQSVMGERVRRDKKTGIVTPLDPVFTGPGPQFVYVDGNNKAHEDITPYDFATIYNVLPLWNAGFTGAGQTIAISAGSDVVLSDYNTFRSTFGLPASTLQVIHNGTDPGLVNGYQGENTLDVEWSGAVAPGATITLVVSQGTTTTAAGNLSDSYIVDNLVAGVMSASYGECEIALGTTGNSAINAIYQQGAAEGISIFESSGDQGSAGCTSQDTAAPNATSFGLQINGLASSPYETAVGGTDFLWQTASTLSAYWNASNASNGSTAKGYIPEIPWNATCTSSYLVSIAGEPSAEQLCNDVYNGPYTNYPDLLKITAGSGGVSNCTIHTGNTLAGCSGGYPKPAWQTGVGVPADSKRDIPDVSLFAAGGYPDGLTGSAYLFCFSENGSNGCDYADPNYIIYQETGGTSASSPAMAGIMALVVQKMGGAYQGLANPVLYKLAAKDNLTSCNTSNAVAGNSCIFYDVTQGTNTQVCNTGTQDCVTNTSGHKYGVLSGYNSGTGFDLTTGLGTVNATNLVNAWGAEVSTQAVTLSPASLTFTSPAVGTASASQTVTVKNTASGALPVTISSVEFAGTNYQAFTGSTTCPVSPATLAAGGTCTVTVAFKPTATGTQTADLAILDNATGSPQFAALSGSVVAAPTATLTPSALTFANTKVGVSSAAQAVTLKNTSTTTLTIGSNGITITGNNPTSFSEITNCGTTLAAGASCTISVTFDPASAGALSAVLNVADNASGSPQKTTLSGTGVSPITATLTPSALTFASTNVGVATAAQVVTLKNSGTATMTINTGGITITGTNATSFSETTNCGSTLAGGASCTISVVFKPAAAGSLSAVLNVADNATGSPQKTTLAGTGVQGATITLTPTSLVFPNTVIGATSDAQTVVVKNAGTVAVTLSSITLTGTNPTSFLQLNTCGTSLAAGASCSVFVAFKPASAAALKATLSVADTATGSPQTVALSGTGTAAPSVTLSASSLTFAATTVGKMSAAQSVTLTNAGTSTLNLNSITITGTNPTSFIQLDTCGATLAPATNCVVYVAFAPTAKGTLTAALTISDNGSASPQKVTLTGTGQ